MKARKIWIAEHPEDCTKNKVRFIAPSDQTEYWHRVYGYEVVGSEYKEYVILEID